MNISSRTPEGEPNRCPICQADIRLEPSQPFGDAPCPNCGHLLWFMQVGNNEPRYFVPGHRQRVWGQVVDALAEILNLPPAQIRDALDRGDPHLLEPARGNAIDSMDMVELVMNLEDEFGPYEQD